MEPKLISLCLAAGHRSPAAEPLHTARRRKGRRGNAIIEFSFLMPWYVFLFVGAIDCGFFSYSLMAVAAGASVATEYAAGSSSTATDATTSCGYALDQLRNMPNVGSGLTTCGTSTVTTSAPVAVTAQAVTGPDGNPAARVTVIYLTPNLVPIPGLFPGQLTITKAFTMRLRS